ncbi:MAG: hypothetical protein E5V40_05925 [Mesorhizobium sp.]|nr:MAG: hypothetical protein E5V40_05925 [Mesorhizobium sp.]
MGSLICIASLGVRDLAISDTILPIDEATTTERELWKLGHGAEKKQFAAFYCPFAKHQLDCSTLIVTRMASSLTNGTMRSSDVV